MVDYFHEHTAMDEENIDTEVDRYIAWPAQRFLQNGADEDSGTAGARAEAVGAEIRYRAFHDAVLDQGPLPLDVLETKINAWIGTQKADTAAGTPALH